MTEQVLAELTQAEAHRYNLFALYDRNGKLYVNGKQVLKGWESMGGTYWFATELDADGPGIHFGLVQGGSVEWGYFDEAELNRMGKYKVWKIPQRNLFIAGRRDRQSELGVGRG